MTCCLQSSCWGATEPCWTLAFLLPATVSICYASLHNKISWKDLYIFTISTYFFHSVLKQPFMPPIPLKQVFWNTNDLHVPNPIASLQSSLNLIYQQHLTQIDTSVLKYLLPFLPGTSLSLPLTGSSSSPRMVLLTSLTINVGVSKAQAWIAVALHLYTLPGWPIPSVALIFYVLSTPEFIPVAPISLLNFGLSYPTVYGPPY